MNCDPTKKFGDTIMLTTAAGLSGNRSQHWLLRSLLCAAVAMGFNSCATTSSPQQSADDSTLDPVPPPSFTRGLLPRDEVAPLYPLRARSLGVEGWVTLSFSVDPDGYVMSNTIQVIEEEPQGFFDVSAINAARRLTFDNTRGEAVEDVRYVFRFELEELQRTSSNNAPVMQFRELIPRRFITPAYPANAEQEGIEGHVVVQFTVLQDGSVRDISVLESNPPGVFDNEALAAAARLRFEPRLILGAPVIVNNVTYRFDWRLPNR